MSPFANQPQLWLTAHLNRLQQADSAIKIQAIARGFLVRSRSVPSRSVPSRSVPSRSGVLANEPPTLAGTMQRLGLSYWASSLPTAAEALSNPQAEARRREAIGNARISLLFMGKKDAIAELEMADYHENSRALSAREPDDTESIWSRLRKFISG